MNKYCVCLMLILCIGPIQSCKKGFLDKKPSTDLVVPTTLADFQALLDNDKVMSETPVLGELSADNFYLDTTFWGKLDAKEHNAYIWAKDIFQGQGLDDNWDIPYEQVFYANVVLDGLPGISVDSGNVQQWNAIKGAACFIRAYAFWNIAQVFAPVYNAKTASTDLGIPLRLTSDVHAISKRATIKQTYDQIIADLQVANALLPQTIPAANLNRPSKPAVLAMLARTYLSMSDSTNAEMYAKDCLNIYSSLLDYNSLAMNTRIFFPFRGTANPEILYQSHLLSSTSAILSVANMSYLFVDTILYRSYSPNDFRDSLFFTNGLMHSIKSGYSNQIFPFSGLATDEVYLIKAECEARNGEPDAKNTLHDLLINRYKMGTLPADTATDVLNEVLLERRKELVSRGLRWTDLKRLNNEGKYYIVLKRAIGEMPYTLEPNSPLYVLPIPPDVIMLSGMPQNPR